MAAMGCASELPAAVETSGSLVLVALAEADLDRVAEVTVELRPAEGVMLAEAEAATLVMLARTLETLDSMLLTSDEADEATDAEADETAEDIMEAEYADEAMAEDAGADEVAASSDPPVRGIRSE
jgi:hypothetical protein